MVLVRKIRISVEKSNVCHINIYLQTMYSLRFRVLNRLNKPISVGNAVISLDAELTG